MRTVITSVVGIVLAAVLAAVIGMVCPLDHLRFWLILPCGLAAVSSLWLVSEVRYRTTFAVGLMLLVSGIGLIGSMVFGIPGACVGLTAMQAGIFLAAPGVVHVVDEVYRRRIAGRDMRIPSIWVLVCGLCITLGMQSVRVTSLQQDMLEMKETLHELKQYAIMSELADVQQDGRDEMYERHFKTIRNHLDGITQHLLEQGREANREVGLVIE